MLWGGRAVNSVVAILKTALSGAFFAAAVNPLIKDIKSIEMKGALRTLAGGTASRLGGGKFASGATSAAMGFLFNEVLHAERSNQDAVQKGQDCDRVCMNKIDGLTEQDVLASIEDGTGWSREYGMLGTIWELNQEQIGNTQILMVEKRFLQLMKQG